MATRILIALALLSASIHARHITVPLARHRGDDSVSTYGISKYRRATGDPSTAIEPATYALHDFWYASYDVGDSKNLSLAIDTGSSILEVNPGLYKPSPDATNLHKKGKEYYSGTMPDGCGYLTLSFDRYEDSVTVQGLTARKQHVADTRKKEPHKPGTITQLPPPFQGIVGLGGNRSQFTLGLGGLPFFANLCKQGQVDECRFGVAFGTSGKGKQILGGVDDSLFEGSLSQVGLVKGSEWVIPGRYASNGSLLDGRQIFILDTGTPNVLGPIEQVRALFELHGIQAVEQKPSGCAKVLFGYYPCDDPPQIGFTVGKSVFNIEPSAFALKHNGANNCTATIVGQATPYGTSDYWLLGQSWMQGKYFDFDQTGESVSAANLKDPVGAT